MSRARSTACGGIKPEIADDELGRTLDVAPADEGAQAGEQLREGQGLRQVVIRARVETRAR